jgi:hypothetical protein
MKTNTALRILLVTVVISGWTAAGFAASGPGNRGTDVLHWDVRKAFSPTNGGISATGHVHARHTRQGRAEHQRLELAFVNLETNGNYHLLAALGDDTNWTYIAPLTATDAGGLAIRYRHSATGNGHLGRAFTAMPDVFMPVSAVSAVAIANSSTQAVLVADLTMPDSFQYLVKRAMTNEGLDPDAVGSVRLQANGNSGSLRVQAWNLDVAATYWVALDGETAFSAISDSRGRFNASSLAADPLTILNLHSVALWNSESNSVLSVTLP